MKVSVFIVLLTMLSGCASKNYHAQFYKKNIDISQVPKPEQLPKGNDPQIFSTKRFDSDYSVLMSKGYILLGYSSFQGEIDPRYNVIQVGRNVGATIVITTNKFLGKDTSTVPLLLPTSSTTYSSGNFSGNTQTSYQNNYGKSYGSSNGTFNGSYNGSETTQSNQWVPVTVTKNIFKQTTAFFVKSNQKFKLGAYYRNLTPKERQEIERNTGVVLTTVIEGSPAFNANLIPGDVVTAINDQTVNNDSSMSHLISTNNNLESISFIRNGKAMSTLFNKPQPSREISSQK